jgi:hypothetical protein
MKIHEVTVNLDVDRLPVVAYGYSLTHVYGYIAEALTNLLQPQGVVITYLGPNQHGFTVRHRQTDDGVLVMADGRSDSGSRPVHSMISPTWYQNPDGSPKMQMFETMPLLELLDLAYKIRVSRRDLDNVLHNIREYLLAQNVGAFTDLTGEHWTRLRNFLAVPKT